MSGTCKALALVAHPDDCVIFAKPFIDSTRFSWTIGYLTYKPCHPRAREIESYWNGKNIETVFLGYNDNHVDLETGVLSFDADNARRDIEQIVNRFDLILTHDSSGDYGHPHHVFVHNAVKDLVVPKVYFANQQDSNFICIGNDIDLTQLPLHRAVIKEFENINTGRYLVTSEALTLLESYGYT